MSQIFTPTIVQAVHKELRHRRRTSVENRLLDQLDRALNVWNPATRCDGYNAHMYLDLGYLELESLWKVMSGLGLRNQL